MKIRTIIKKGIQHSAVFVSSRIASGHRFDYFIHFVIWRLSQKSESGYWDNVLQRRVDGERDSEVDYRLDPASVLQSDIREAIDAPEGSALRFLDVGAGPFSDLGKVWPGRRIETIAVDPLAEKYDMLMVKYNLTPPVRTVKCAGEDLSKTFETGSFDLVYANNSLDHSYHPFKVFVEMLRMVKKSKCCYIRHFVNEGKEEDYTGMHQWDFFSRDGKFFISSSLVTIDITQSFQKIAITTVTMLEHWYNPIICVKFEKLSDDLDEILPHYV